MEQNINFFVECIGLTAACCTTFAFLPQVIRLYRTHVTAGVSLWTFLLSSLGTLLWLAYGIMIFSPALIIANSLTFILAISIVTMKLMWE